ncbi:alpha/beta hydrolase [Spectribacter hydrogenooxidans]|uniref:Alpha/beta fold hydrolase n=1 Tax=Spectribacter hydrogenoxidans TaxID=3075608 RepID=A0ABU3C0A9_9GAMM|nr:alpha/beta fold hydrolase [Salinisphaera sp. W335]MDT0634991.1 alpha/beta fold hydrolase [Salinisphaera sp. W335]
MTWPDRNQRREASVPGPVGNLAATIETGAEAPRGIAVICHPHPLHGGTRQNKVVTTLGRAARAAGFDALRFDFRGVGDSQGEHDDGIGEQDDCRAAVAYARDACADLPIALMGFSFGAATALRVAAADGAAALITVGLPAGYFEGRLPTPDCRWLAVHGSADEIADPDAARAALTTLTTPPQMQWMPETGHFFHGRLGELKQMVADFLRAEPM